jgi:hypothetical protein
MRVIQCFFDVDMRCAHDGLAVLAKVQKIDVAKLDAGEYVIFINTAKNRLKMFAPGGVVAYYRAHGGERINLNTIPLIPRAFNATGRIDYDKALREVLEKQLAKRAERKA